LIDRLRLPVAPFWSTFAFVVGLGFMIYTRVMPHLPYGYDEIGELMFAFAALGLAIRGVSKPNSRRGSTGEVGEPMTQAAPPL